MLDLGHLYVALLDALADAPVGALNDRAATSAHQTRAHDLRRRVDSGVDVTPASTDRSELFALACALHDALADLDPAVADVAPAALVVYRDRLIGFSNLLGGGAGAALVLSRTYPARPQAGPTTLDEVLPRLRHLRADACAHLTFSRVSRVDDIDVDPGFALRVASVPMLAERRDLRFHVVTGANRRYTTSPVATRVSERMGPALEALDASGAHLAVLPEASCTEALLAEWQRLCRSSPPAVGSSLTFLMVGTGPITSGHVESRVAPDGGPAPNRAALIHRRTGDVLLLQDKQRGFSMDSRYLTEHGLVSSVGRETIDEELPTAPALNLLESTVGRIAVLICEDLGRVATVGAQACQAAVSHALVPILAPPILVGRWQESAGEQLVAEGVTVVVVNSLALGREDRRWNESTREVETQLDVPAVTLLAVYPDESVAEDQWSGRVQRAPQPGAALISGPAVDAVTARIVTFPGA